MIGLLGICGLRPNGGNKPIIMLESTPIGVLKMLFARLKVI